MKHLFIIALITLSTSVYGQLATLELKSGETQEVQIVAHSSTDLYISGGQIKQADVSTIYFTDSLENRVNMYEALKNSGVKIIFDGVERAEITKPEPTILVNNYPTMNQENWDNLHFNIESFRKDRATAKAFQLVGILAIGGSVLMQAIYNNQYEQDLDDYIQNPTGTMPKAKNVPSIIPGAGLGLMTIGISLDLTAGGRLKIRRN